MKLPGRPNRLPLSGIGWAHNLRPTPPYFSRMRGDAILDTAARYVRLNGTVMDLGAGPGYLSEKLLKRGAHVIAVDLSPQSVATLQSRLASHPNFMGAYASTPEHVPVPDNTVDAIFLVETIEHLDDNALNVLLRETFRLLKPQGCVVITTPNEEDLALARVICPDCGSIFHNMQHVRSWSAAGLMRTLGGYGYQPLVCKPTLFSQLPEWFRPFNSLAYTLTNTELPHLLYIGRKG